MEGQFKNKAIEDFLDQLRTRKMRLQTKDHVGTSSSENTDIEAKARQVKSLITKLQHMPGSTVSRIDRRLNSCISTLEELKKKDDLSWKLSSLASNFNVTYSKSEDGRAVSLRGDNFSIEVLSDDSPDREPGAACSDVKVRYSLLGNVAMSSPDLRDVMASEDLSILSQSITHLNWLSSRMTADVPRQQQGQIFQAWLALVYIVNNYSNMTRWSEEFSNVSSIKDAINRGLIGLVTRCAACLPISFIYSISPLQLARLTREHLKKERANISPSLNHVNVGYKAKISMCRSDNMMCCLPMYGDLLTDSTAPSLEHTFTLEKMWLPACYHLMLESPLPIFRSSFNNLIKRFGESSYMRGEMDDDKTSLVWGRSDDDAVRSAHFTTVILPPCKGSTEEHDVYELHNPLDVRKDEVWLSAVVFSDPTLLPHLLNHLRGQVAFTECLRSCVGEASGSAGDEVVDVRVEIERVNTLSLSIANTAECAVTLENDDVVGAMKCRVFVEGKEDLTLSNLATETLNATWSVPLTVRNIARNTPSSSPSHSRNDTLLNVSVVEENELPPGMIIE